MKRYLLLLFATVFLIVSAFPVQAARPQLQYQVTFNGHPVLFDVQPEVLPPGHTMVPFRAIFEKMGADVQWDDATQTVTATRDGTTVQLTIGNAQATVNGVTKTQPVAPYIKDGRTLVPLRFVSEALGADVKYDPATTKITINDKNWPKRGGTLNFAVFNNPTGKFNPIIDDDDYTAQIVGALFDSLWRYDEHVVPQPALAESWEWNSDFTQLTFYLRHDVKFHDGTPLTAKDVVFTYKAIFHPKYVGPRNSGFEDILGWEDYTKGIKGESAANFDKGIVTPEPLEGLYAPDDYTVVFKMKQPNAVFLVTQAVYGIVSYEDYKNVPVQDWGMASDPNMAHPNGTGAFKFDQWVDGQYAVLTAFDDYWAGRPYADKLIYRVVASDVAVGEMQRGTLDYVVFNAPDYNAYHAMSNVKILEYPDVRYQYMGFNTQAGPASDKRVRQAIAYGIDRQSIIHDLLQDHGSAMYTPIHPLTWAYSDDVEKYSFNKQKAGQLLDEAGWKMGAGGIREKDGKKLHLRLVYPNVGNQVRIRTAPVFQQMMKDIGIEVELVGYDFATVLKKVQEEYDFDMYFLGFVLGNTDPDPTGIWDKNAIGIGGFNAERWWTPKSEELIAAGKKTADIDERIDIYAQWQKHWAEELPAYIFYANNSLVAYNKRLQNFRPIPTSYTWNLEELWVK